jgi:tetraacyldisaccharide 4'-kinase
LLNPSQFRDLVSGRRRGVAAAIERCGLRLAEVPYTWVVRWRNRRYDTGRAEICRVDVPVLSVGNLTLGGTGKTPMVEWLARWFRGHGVRVAIVSRGYGAEAGARNDEALELQQRLPDVPHLQEPDRVAAASTAVKEFNSQLILLDDAFQHRRIARDLDIVLLDALEPFGFGHVFPRGTLREPLCGLRRAHVVALSRADMLDPPQREEVWRVVRRHNPQAVRLEVAHAARALISSGGREEPLGSLASGTGVSPVATGVGGTSVSPVACRVAAFCGIGNPAGFRHTLRSCGYQVVDFREFPDHHPYDRGDLESLAAWADGLDVAAVLCTHKDLVKLVIDRLGRHPLRALRVGLEFLAGQELLEARLVRLLPM